MTYTETEKWSALHWFNGAGHDPVLAAKYRETISAHSALVDRTWKADVTPNRDARRLMARYKAQHSAVEAEVVTAWREATQPEKDTQ